MLVIVIVSWNVKVLLEQCIWSLIHNATTLASQAIVVVDNHSNDGTVEAIRTIFSGHDTVEVIASETNVGFTGGNNIGLKRAAELIPDLLRSESYALLLNPDTIVSPGCLDQLIGYATAHPDVGIVGPQLRYGDGSIQSSRRRFPTLQTLMFESTWLQSMAPKAILDAYYFADVSSNEPCAVDWLVGAALLVRFVVYEQCGGLDSMSFFMYCEEIDWCLRIKQEGWLIVYYPEAHITHFEGASSVQASTNRMCQFNISKVHYARKHIGIWQARILRSWLMFQFMVQTIIERIKLVIGNKPDLRSSRLRDYRTVIKSLANA